MASSCLVWSVHGIVSACWGVGIREKCVPHVLCPNVDVSRHTESQRLAPLLMFNRNYAFAQDSIKHTLTDNKRKTGQNQLK